MTEPDWLKAANPDAMLRAVGDRLSPRRWHLLAAAAARRAADALPDGPFRAAIDWAERHAGQPPDAAKLAELESLAPATVEAAKAAQREIVRPADPDLDPADFKHSDAAPIPSVVFYQAACQQAVTAVEQAGAAAETATQVVLALVSELPGAELLANVRAAVVEATRLRGAASLAAAAALDFKASGDAAADRVAKNVRLQYAAALETVRKTEEELTGRVNDLDDQKAKADQRAVGRFLHDLVGNPFKPYRLDPAWRTDDVMSLAKAIHDDRTFDRMPALADALLDADCDEEAVLRHCRGTEAHAPEGPAHGRGCWVLDLISQHEPALFAGPALVPPPPPPPPPPAAPPPKKPAGRPAAADPMAALFAALKKGVPPPDDDDD